MGSPEERLLKQARRFEMQALAQIYDTHSPGLYRYAARFLGDVDVAEDCVAETFSRFLQVLHAGKGPESYLQAYLYRIAHNWITDYYRRQPPPSLPLEAGRNLPGGDDPGQAAFKNLQAQEVRAALQQLTPDQRQVVMLKYLQGWENDQVAAALNKPVGAVKSLQHRALRALRRLLSVPEVGDVENV
jgi:RNA polymerase sigma-70 factor (ECF subfamily)